MVSPYEFWPGWAIYGPLVAYWVLLGLRHRDFSLPGAANPNIPSGGLCGEGKTAILDQVQGDAREWIAPYEKFVTGSDDEKVAEGIIARLNLSFPLVLKPDVGCKGAGVKLIPGARDLARTLALYPRGVAVLLQEFIPFEGEAGIFYSREPGAATGRILSLTLKTSPQIVGDGMSTVKDLVLNHARAKHAPQVYLPRLAGRLTDVLPEGDVLRLVFTGNHSKGSMFRNASAVVTRALTQKIDEILQSLPEFHHGRIDVRFDTIDRLRNADGFRIIEINGVGSEPIHMWDPDASLLDIYIAQFRSYGTAFRIGRAMRQRGHRSSGLRVMWRLWHEQSRLMALYPSSD